MGGVGTVSYSGFTASKITNNATNIKVISPNKNSGIFETSTLFY